MTAPTSASPEDTSVESRSRQEAYAAGLCPPWRQSYREMTEAPRGCGCQRIVTLAPHSRGHSCALQNEASHSLLGSPGDVVGPVKFPHSRFSCLKATKPLAAVHTTSQRCGSASIRGTQELNQLRVEEIVKPTICPDYHRLFLFALKYTEEHQLYSICFVLPSNIRCIQG